MPRKAKPKIPGSINPSAPASPGGSMPNTPTGLAYGEHQQLANAQAAIPVGGTPTPAPAPTGAPPPAPMPTPAANLAPNPVADTYNAAQQFTPPNLGLGAPSANPGEHVTAPIVGPVPTTTGRLSQTLAQAAQLSGSPSLLALAKLAQDLGQ